MKWGRKNAVWLLLGLIASFLLLYKLNSLTVGLSKSEYLAMTRGLGWHGIFNSILYLPLTVIRSALALLIGTNHLFIDRLPNAIYGLLTIGLFAFVIRSWHDRRTTILTTLLFMCSPLVLHVSRIVGFDVLQLLVLPAIFSGNILLRQYPDSKLAFYLVVIVWAIICLIPGGIWLVLLNCWLKREDIIDSVKDLNTFKDKLSGFFVILLFILPTILVLLGRTNILSWIGLPSEYDSLISSLKHLALTPYYLFLRPEQQPEIWLERAPLLNIFNLVMFFIGLAYYIKHWSAGRTKQITAFFVLCVLLIGLDGLVSFAMILPLLYMIIAMGLNTISKQWFRTFPVNPLARSVGNILIISAVVLSCIYGIRSYFVAWPYNSTTKATFTIKV